ncbi:MAG: PrgI family protein [Candidatus Paceibacterota bacterium]|jgi:hypothetical protein
MQFQVPQFIEVEDKIFGPFTFKQFVYLIGGAGGGYAIYHFVPYTFLGGLLAMPIVALGFALAFYRVNDRPFIDVLESALRFYSAKKLYVWQHPSKRVEQTKVAPEPAQKEIDAKLTSNKLNDLAWSLDIRVDNQEKK